MSDEVQCIPILYQTIQTVYTHQHLGIVSVLLFIQVVGGFEGPLENIKERRKGIEKKVGIRC